MSATETVKKLLSETLSDGIKIGWQAAADVLEAAIPNVAKENQTWESAIAMMRLINLDDLPEVKVVGEWAVRR